MATLSFPLACWPFCFSRSSQSGWLSLVVFISVSWKLTPASPLSLAQAWVDISYATLNSERNVSYAGHHGQLLT